ncbi:hypothetical protein D9757_009025 [Collybiopsis confluens]|uniref:Uncharacterized protein n=1 Tax=Collybiopsis confluens TaxID=2823264 RepID=A0A8H5HDU3_9AGAR|nr:hypothetical protein D9757_009025 [Collybiopsis confluens]
MLILTVTIRRLGNILYLVSIAIFSLRVYALYGQRKSVLVIFTGIAFLGTAISVAFILEPGSLRTIGTRLFCYTKLGKVIFAFDSFVPPCSHAVPQQQEDIKCISQWVWAQGRSGLELHSLVLFSGTIMQRHLTAPVGCLSVTLMSRMFLNMHKASETGIYTISTDSTPEDAHQSALRIRSPPQAQF